MIPPHPGRRRGAGKVVPIWHAICQANKNGPIPNLFNAMLALANDREWKGRFRYNEMLQSVVLDEHPLSDVKVYEILHWLQANGIHRLPETPVRQAIALLGSQQSFHPVRDWLDGLHGNGSPQIATWMSRYLGAPDTEYHRQVGVLFLAAMVARIYEPGCKQDYTLVLEGPQKKEKSRFCEALAGGEDYFSDSLPSLEYDKDVSAHLAGKWVIEISELSAFQRADNEKLKAFLTRRYEKYRPAFGRSQVNEPRQCVFVATTNKRAWSKDETGARRFWPVRCGQIEVDAFAANRDQLFAEAVSHYRTHRRWWPEGDIEDQHFVPEQAERYEGDAWEQSVADWDRCIPVETIDAYGNNRSERVKLNPPFYLNDVAFGAVNLKIDRFGVSDQRRIVQILEHMGWKRAKRTARGIPWTPN